MQEMMEFCMWFLAELPDFLMAEPICYLVGFGFLFVVLALFKSLVNIHRS